MSLPIRIETITLGDELLLGIRENAHLSYLGIQLAHHGIEPSANLVVRDHADEIKTFFSESWKRSDLVITTGGLGPTSDDLTRETIAEILDEELVFDPSIEHALRERFSNLGRAMPENNLRQCYRPKGAEVLANPYGTAPGLLIQKEGKLPEQSLRTCLNGILVQDKDLKTDLESDLNTVTKKAPSSSETQDLLFASKLCKHTKSNTIVLAKNQQLLASGTGQTSRVDALHQAIHKAQNFGFDLQGAVLASDAFFPFPDCVEIASKQGIKAVIQPGGSIKDNLSVEYCDSQGIAMVFTGIRHFKH